MPQGLVGWIIKAALDWLFSKLKDYVAARAKQQQSHDENEARSNDDHVVHDKVKNDPNATEADRDKATDDRLSRF